MTTSSNPGADALVATLHRQYGRVLLELQLDQYARAQEAMLDWESEAGARLCRELREGFEQDRYTIEHMDNVYCELIPLLEAWDALIALAEPHWRGALPDDCEARLEDGLWSYEEGPWRTTSTSGWFRRCGQGPDQAEAQEVLAPVRLFVQPPDHPGVDLGAVPGAPSCGAGVALLRTRGVDHELLVGLVGVAVPAPLDDEDALLEGIDLFERDFVVGSEG